MQSCDNLCDRGPKNDFVFVQTNSYSKRANLWSTNREGNEVQRVNWWSVDQSTGKSVKKFNDTSLDH